MSNRLISRSPEQRPVASGMGSRAWINGPRVFALWVFVIWTLSLLPTPAAAQSEVRIGYLNSERILSEYTSLAEAEKAYRQDVDDWNREAQARKREIERLEAELDQQEPMLSDEKGREKQEDYVKKVGDYEKFVQSIWGPNGKVTQRNEEILRPIIKRVQEILTEIAQLEGYTLILDAADGNILYADPSLDLTQQVLDELNVQQTVGQ